MPIICDDLSHIDKFLFLSVLSAGKPAFRPRRDAPFSKTSGITCRIQEGEAG